MFASLSTRAWQWRWYSDTVSDDKGIVTRNISFLCLHSEGNAFRNIALRLNLIQHSGNSSTFSAKCTHLASLLQR